MREESSSLALCNACTAAGSARPAAANTPISARRARIGAYSAACIVRAFSISASARRYSTGITLTNFGK